MRFNKLFEAFQWMADNFSRAVVDAAVYPLLLCASVFAVVLAGCAVGPDYRRPQVALPNHYIEQAAGINRGRLASATELATWWQGFDDPLLTHFVQQALAQNLDLAQASARVLQARAALGAANAALLPSGAVSGSAARAQQSLETPLGQMLNANPGYNRWGNAYEADLTASWEVDVFGGVRRGRQAALADYQASQADAVATRLAVAAQTADLYISLGALRPPNRKLLMP
jgi:outer membrane protein TolC